MTEVDLQKYQFIFVCGLHRSGTTVLHRCLSKHPSVSGFSNTGVYEDEGQHLQSVYQRESRYGGPGIFGFFPGAQLTETSPLVTEENRNQLFIDWSEYWDISKPILIEKTPSNMIRTRFFQELFPNTYFVAIIRHPVAVALAHQLRWFFRLPHQKTKGVLYKMGIRHPLWLHFSHWLHCHNIFMEDIKHLKNIIVINYENFVTSPQEYLNKIYNSIGIPGTYLANEIQNNINQKYFNLWKQRSEGVWSGFINRWLIDTYEKRINQYGYSLIDLDHFVPFELI
jgi:hypothetical protein